MKHSGPLAGFLGYKVERGAADVPKRPESKAPSKTGFHGNDLLPTYVIRADSRSKRLATTTCFSHAHALYFPTNDLLPKKCEFGSR
jgi:hypothetical protein